MSAAKKALMSRVLVLLIVLTLAFIWGNSMLGSEQSAGVSNGFLDFIRPLLEILGLESGSDLWLRKLAHFCEFALLGAELSALSILKGKIKLRDFSCGSMYCLAAAAADETIQYFSGRYSHVLDVLLDFSGSICGIVVICTVFAAVIKYNGKTI